MAYDRENLFVNARKLQAAGLLTEENRQALRNYPGNTKLLSTEQMIRRDAANGDKFAQFQLGIDYANNGNLVEAIKWLELSACQTYPAAQYELGSILLLMAKQINTEKREETHSKAMFWIEMAADHGFTEAKYKLGTMYISGEAPPRAGMSPTMTGQKLGEIYLKDAASEHHLSAKEALRALTQTRTDLITNCRSTLYTSPAQETGRLTPPTLQK